VSLRGRRSPSPHAAAVALIKRAIVPIASTVLLLAACHRKWPEYASSVRVADPERRHQLISGFYDVVNHQWCWTARQFQVLLGPPKDGGTRGGVLTVNLYFPDNEMNEVGSITLTAYTGDFELESVTYKKAGVQEYRSDVPPEALCTDIVPIQFIFDKALPPSNRDPRELGAVVTSITLRAK
jgi:hypothetical protein